MATLWLWSLCPRGESYSHSSWSSCTADLMGKAWFLHENQSLKNSAEENSRFPLRFDCMLNRNLRLPSHVSLTSSYQYILKGFMENSTCPHWAPHPYSFLLKQLYQRGILLSQCFVFPSPVHGPNCTGKTLKLKVES